MGLYCKCGNPITDYPGQHYHRGDEVCEACRAEGLQPRKKRYFDTIGLAATRIQAAKNPTSRSVCSAAPGAPSRS